MGVDAAELRQQVGEGEGLRRQGPVRGSLVPLLDRKGTRAVLRIRLEQDRLEECRISLIRRRRQRPSMREVAEAEGGGAMEMGMGMGTDGYGVCGGGGGSDGDGVEGGRLRTRKRVLNLPRFSRRPERTEFRPTGPALRVGRVARTAARASVRPRGEALLVPAARASVPGLSEVFF